MSAIISTIMGVYTEILTWCGKVLGSLTAKVAELFAKLGLKILSINWIKTIYEYLKKVLSVIKKTIFNVKFVTLVKYLLSFAIVSCAVVQTVFFAHGYFDNISVVIESFKNFELETICVALLVLGGVTYSLICCVRFILQVFRKHINLHFVRVVLLTYVTVLCYHNLIQNNLSGGILAKVELIDVIGIMTAVYAFFALFDGEHSISVFGTLLIGVGLTLIFVFFNINSFFDFLHYELVGEGSFSLKDLNAFKFINAFQSSHDVSGVESLLVTWCGELAQANIFLKSVSITLNLFIIIGCTLLPYLFLSAAAEIVIALISNRVMQYVYLNKSLAILRFVFFYAALVLCASLVVALLFQSMTDLFVLASVDIGNVILTLSGIIVTAIVLSIARKLIASKPYVKIKKIGLK